MKMEIAEEAAIGLYRDALPTDFSFEIRSFTSLAKSSIEKVESNDFKAGGYNWKLVLYPNGKQKEDGKGYISMYLEMVETTSHPPGWEANVSFRFFVYDQVRDKYLILGDLGGSTQRFHAMKTKWGFSKLLPITTLKQPLSGFLVDDTCVFGAEVRVCKCTGNGDCLWMLREPTTMSYTWNIRKFSEHNEVYLVSERFTAGDQAWGMSVYPKGDAKERNIGLSVFLFLSDWKTLAPGMKVYADFKLRIRNQTSNKHKEYQDAVWFSATRSGCSKLIALSELNNRANGFLINDVCIIEVEVTVLGTMKKNDVNFLSNKAPQVPPQVPLWSAARKEDVFALGLCFMFMLSVTVPKLFKKR